MMKMINLLNFEKLCTVPRTETGNPLPEGVSFVKSGVGRKETTIFPDNQNYFFNPLKLL